MKYGQTSNLHGVRLEDNCACPCHCIIQLMLLLLQLLLKVVVIFSCCRALSRCCCFWCSSRTRVKKSLAVDTRRDEVDTTRVIWLCMFIRVARIKPLTTNERASKTLLFSTNTNTNISRSWSGDVNICTIRGFLIIVGDSPTFNSIVKARVAPWKNVSIIEFVLNQYINRYLCSRFFFINASDWRLSSEWQVFLPKLLLYYFSFVLVTILLPIKKII